MDDKPETKIKEIIDYIRSVKGIKDVRLLKDGEKREIGLSEKDAEKLVLMGLMPGINYGIREALARSFTLAGITTEEFEWPIRGTVKFLYRGVVVGEEVRDNAELKQFEKDGDRIIGGTFVLFADKIRVCGLKNLNECTLIIDSLDLSWIREIPYTKYAVIGSPSPPTDLCIKKFLNIDNTGRLGSVLIGFEIV